MPGCTEQSNSQDENARVAEQSEATPGEKPISAEWEHLGRHFYGGKGELQCFVISGADSQDNVHGLAVFLYATEDGESVRISHGLRADGEEGAFSAEVYFLTIETPLGETPSQEMRFSVTSRVGERAVWGGDRRDFAIDLDEYESPGARPYVPHLEPGGPAILANYYWRRRGVTESEEVQEYRETDNQLLELPLPPLVTSEGEVKEQGDIVVVVSGGYEHFDLAAVREHTVKTGDVVVSVVAHLLTSEELEHAQRAKAATLLVIQLATEYAKQHSGAWPRAWEDLEEVSGAESREFEWPDDLEEIKEYVSVDFGVSPEELSKQSVAEFDAIQPIGLHPPYKDEEVLDTLLQTLRRSHASETSSP